jgi:hypothetical protein
VSIGQTHFDLSTDNPLSIRTTVGAWIEWSSDLDQWTRVELDAGTAARGVAVSADHVLVLTAPVLPPQTT